MVRGEVVLNGSRLAEADAGDGDLGEQVRGCGAGVGVAGQEGLELGVLAARRSD